MNDYLTVLKNYATFTGRARRREYWMFYLINSVIVIVLQVLLTLGGFSTLSGDPTGGTVSPFAWVVLAIMAVYSLGVLLPNLAVTVRRLHDTGRSGWFFLLILIPLIGALILLVLLVQDSQPGDNKWGPNPKGAVAVTPAF